MPSSVGSALLALGAILTTVSAISGCAVAAAAVLWEVFLFYMAGRTS